MRTEALDQQTVADYVDALRTRLRAGDLNDKAAQAAAVLPDSSQPPAETIAAALPDRAGPPSSGPEGPAPFLARDPVASLLQTSLDEKLHERNLGTQYAAEPRPPDIWSRIGTALRRLLHARRFSPEDPGWVTGIGEAVLDHLARGNHPFNVAPATYGFKDNARVVIVGDWGTGLPRARDVAKWMAQEVEDALSHGREAHVIHLGDVYYSGDPVEYERRVLAPGLWPVTAEQSQAGVTSWSLNGNHDMYSGGWGYFDRLLAEERFARQRSADGKPTSFFHLTTPSWNIVGLDTSWSPAVLYEGHKAVLHDAQVEHVAKAAADGSRKLMLLSHHQPISVYAPDDIGPELLDKLQPALGSRRVDAWLWGHEHRCMGFASTPLIEVPRCIGHGGVPVLAHPADYPIPAPGTWEERGYLESGGQRLARFGFAVLDFQGPTIQVRYRDDTGAETPPPETLA